MESKALVKSTNSNVAWRFFARTPYLPSNRNSPKSERIENAPLATEQFYLHKNIYIQLNKENLAMKAVDGIRKS